jgi:hypothetical protein
VRRIIVACAALSMAVAGLLGVTWSPPAAHASSGNGNGEFIIRCFMTGEVHATDPIMVPGGKAPHVHMFFGNNNVVPGSIAAGLRTHGTSCQDSNDTAAYWAPESFMNGTPYLPGCKALNDGTGNYSCTSDPSGTINIRAYYLTGAGASTNELPAGLIMVAGTPDATSAPTNEDAIYWDCGATSITDPTTGKQIKVQTPESIWPYDCSLYQGSDFPTNQQEGLAEIINFPACWDRGNSFMTPNGTAMVPGYLAPPLNMGTTNDLKYDPCNGTYTTIVPHVSMRIHYMKLYDINPGSATIYPSSCAAATGLGPNVTCQSQANPPPGNIAFQLSSTQTNAAPGPWYTEHADYWQTWQQGSSPPSASSAPGTLNSLTYDCLDLPQTCGFVKDGSYPTPPSSP